MPVLRIWKILTPQLLKWQADANGHWKTCAYCGLKFETGSHTGKTATCTQKAVCEICGQEYGGFALIPDGPKCQRSDRNRSENRRYLQSLALDCAGPDSLLRNGWRGIIRTEKKKYNTNSASAPFSYLYGKAVICYEKSHAFCECLEFFLNTAMIM